MGFRPKKINTMSNKLSIPARICLRTSILGKCTSNLIWITILANKKRGPINGKLILLISDLGRWLRISFIMRWNKLSLLKLILIISHRPSLSKIASMIFWIRKIINLESLRIWVRSNSLPNMCLELEFSPISGMQGNAWKVRELSMMWEKMMI